MPNQDTLFKLLLGYCHRGDIEGSKQILQHAKSAGMSLTEQVYSAFILGKGRAGQVEVHMLMYTMRMDISAYTLSHGPMNELIHTALFLSNIQFLSLYASLALQYHHSLCLLTASTFSSLLPSSSLRSPSLPIPSSFIPSPPLLSSHPFFLPHSAASRDLEGARSVLTMMKDKDITAGTESYGALAAAFAERGDMEGVEKVGLQ